LAIAFANANSRAENYHKKWLGFRIIFGEFTTLSMRGGATGLA
jgi:hypothetical protein